MTDIVIHKAWSSIQVGDFVRWALPNGIKYGHVTSTPGGRSLVVKFIEDDRPRSLPDARWYFVEGKRSADAEEHLVCIDYSAWYNEGKSGFTPVPPPHPLSESAWMSVDEVAEYLNWDEKKVRRYIRKGVIVAHKREDRWRVNGERLKAQAAKQGWV